MEYNKVEKVDSQKHHGAVLWSQNLHSIQKSQWKRSRQPKAERRIDSSCAKNVRRGPQEFHINQQIAVVLTATIYIKKTASAMVPSLKLELNSSLKYCYHVEAHGSVKSEQSIDFQVDFCWIILHALSLFGSYFCALLLWFWFEHLSNLSVIGIDILAFPCESNLNCFRVLDTL